jgi:hypothetical protein
MSKRANGSSILTANRLSDGRVVFLDFDGSWHERINVAFVARTTQEVAELEKRGAVDVAQNLIVEPYLVEVREAEGQLLPIRQRERIRAGGPSVLDEVPGYVSPITALGQAQDEEVSAADGFQPPVESVESRTAAEAA